MTRPASFRWDLRPWALAVVAGVTSTDPTYALRGGAVVCAILLATSAVRWRPSAPDVFAAALTVLAVLSTTWATTPANTAASVTNYVAVLCIFLCVRAVVRSKDDLSIVAAGYVVGCLYAVYLVISENAISGSGIELTDVRFGIAGVNLNYLAYSLITGVVVGFLLWRHSFFRLLLVAAVALLFVGSWLAASRAVALSGLCLVLWLLIYRLGAALSFRILGLVVVSAGLAVPAGLADSLLRQIEGGTARATGDLSGRLTSWPIARDVFSDNPLIGIGAGGFAGVNPYGIGAHDVVLEVGTGMGVLGLCLFFATLYAALIGSTRMVEIRRRCLLIGSLIVVWTPIYLSGHWDLSPAAWLTIGLFSRIGSTTRLPVNHEVPGGVNAHAPR